MFSDLITPVLQKLKKGRRLGGAESGELFDEVAQQQHPVSGFRMHPHHRVLGFEVLGGELVAVPAFGS